MTVRREGDLALAVTAARLAGPDGGVVWTLRDITERARLEQAKSDFVATASHELRSPLTSIKGFIELLESTDNQNLTERQLEFIHIALQSTDRLAELVNDLLDIARIESGQFEIHPRSVDLRDTVTEVAAMIEPRLQAKRQRLDLQIYDPRPPALADPARIRQIVTNLVTNAHLYTPEEGTITLRLEADAQTTTITVADTGRGVSPEEARRLFDRFYRGSTDERKSPGTGLGLAIVKSLVDLHGGTIDVQSTVGVGTTFTVRLPSAPNFGGLAQRPPTSATPAALSARRVLIVDDEPALAALIAQQLRPLGMDTVQVHSGADAIARLQPRALRRDDARRLHAGDERLRRAARGARRRAAARDPGHLRLGRLARARARGRVGGAQADRPRPPHRGHRRGDPGAPLARARRRARRAARASSSRRWRRCASSIAGRRRPTARRGPARRSSSRSRSSTRAWARRRRSSTEPPYAGAATAVRVIVFTTDGDGQTAAGGVGMPVFGLPEAVSALRTALGERPTDRGR